MKKKATAPRRQKPARDYRLAQKCPDCGNALTEVLVFFAAKPPTQRSLEPG
jgi:hypothetical protein